jgi:hypothetical protein
MTTMTKIEAATNKLEMLLHFESMFEKVAADNKAASPADLIEALAKATVEWVEGYDECISQAPAGDTAKMTEALTLLTNGFKYSTEVVTIARNALDHTTEAEHQQTGH